VLLAVLLASFSGVIYFSLRTFLIAQVSDVARDRGRMVDIHSGGRGSGHSVSTSGPGLVEEFASPGVYLQIWDQANRIAGRSANLGNRRLPLPRDLRTISSAVEGIAREITIPPAKSGSKKGEHLLVWYAPLRIAGEQVGLVQVGVPLSPTDKLLHQTAILLIVGMIIILSIAIPIGLVLARMLLKPIDRITLTAEAIAKGDLSRRIGGHGPPDEVGRLAAIFDGMIATLDNVFQTQRRFLSDAGHELRTPVTTILGHANFLRRWPKADADERNEAIKAIISTGEHMSHIVNDLLQLASSDERKTIETEQIALNDLIEEEYTRATQLSDGLDICLKGTEPLFIMGDRDQIRRVFTNLLDNAIKFTPAGGTVTISLEGVDDKAVVVVTDTGTGIPSEDLPHIFKRFYHANNSHSRQKGGTGLGLAIVNKIVLAHGGTIEVESVVGNGSTFRVQFTQYKPAQT
jgi:two-component system, OmpR family, sensor kinase